MDLASDIRTRATGGGAEMSICVLLGGDAAERTVSLASGLSVGRALASRGHRVLLLDPATGTRVKIGSVADAELQTRIGIAPSPGGLRLEAVSEAEASARTKRIVPALAELPKLEVDLVVNMLHGGVGEGGAIPALLDLLGVPYVGSDSISSAVTMDKDYAKDILRKHGIPVARDFLWDPKASPPHVDVPEAEIGRLGGFPVVVKPLSEGSSVGITIVESDQDWPRALLAAAPFAHPTRGIMVEEYIPGRELTVGIVDEVALPVAEIIPKDGFYDFEHKYTRGESDYQVPAAIPGPLGDRLCEWAMRSYHAFGCRGLARVDFRVSPGEKVACLELNTLPGMTETSLLPMAAKAVGIEFEELLELLCRRALV